MRLNRGTAIFFIILVVVIAVAYMLMNSNSNRSSEATATPSVKQKLFPNVDSADITALTISQQVPVEDTRPTPLPGDEPLPTLTPVPEDQEAPTQAEILSVSKDDGGNWLVGDETTFTPINTIDLSKLNTVLQSIADAQAEAFIPEDGDYTQYGLDNPTYEITFVVKPSSSEDAESTETEAVTRRLQIGDRSFDNLGFYAFLDDDSETVYVITGANLFKRDVLDTVTTPPFVPTATPIPPIKVDVPGTVFYGLDPASASRLTITNEETGESIILTKLDDGINWEVENGDPDREVNQAKITTTFMNVSDVEAVSKATIDDLSTVGLDNPSYILRGEYHDGRKIEVALGDKDPTGTLYYARVDDGPDVILITTSGIEYLLDLIENPPYTVVESTPEATVEAMEATEEMTPEATIEMTVEATETSG